MSVVQVICMPIWLSEWGYPGRGGGGVISVTTIDKRKGRWGIHLFFSFCVCVSGIQRGES